jgi:hypothetical protein
MSEQRTPHSLQDEAPVRKIDPSEPEARDEGPRLIPLEERRREQRPFEPDRRYIDLADTAMKRPVPTRGRAAEKNQRKGGTK